MSWVELSWIDLNWNYVWISLKEIIFTERNISEQALKTEEQNELDDRKWANWAKWANEQSLNKTIFGYNPMKTK